MLLKIYSRAKHIIGFFDNYDQESLCINNVLDMDDKTLSFTAKYSDIKAAGIVLGGHILIDTVGSSYDYATSDDPFSSEEYANFQNNKYHNLFNDYFIVYEINVNSNGKTEIIAKKDFRQFEYAKSRISADHIVSNPDAFIRNLLPGWSVLGNGTFSSYTRRIEAGIDTKYNMLKKYQTLFDIEYIIDTKNNYLTYICGQRGVQRETIFSDDLNLKSLTMEESMYDVYSIVKAHGYDGLTFESINGGKDYVEDKTFLRGWREYEWNAPEYTVAEDLLAGARKKLAQISVPYKSYTVDIIDLRNAPGYEYDRYDYDIGDTIVIMDSTTETFERFRIVEMNIYPNMPNKNSIVLANRNMKLSDLL